MKLSVVIPVLNEAIALPATLAALATELRGRTDVDIVAVDGGSSDSTLDILAAMPQIRVIEAPRGRASQLNAGAAAAAGDVLLFLHADTLLACGALDSIADAARRKDFAYGGFHHRWSGRDWRLRLISFLHNVRCRITWNFYGDQALFVSREAFDAAGGFPEDAWVEDIAICMRLRRRARPAFLRLAVVTSSRKFERMGVWRSFGRVLAILLCLQLGRKPPAAFFADIR